MNAYLFIIVPAMAIMCIVFAWIIAGDIKAILRSMRGSGKYDSIRHKAGSRSRNYGHAAIFLGTACLFVGTPQECEDVCDDLWHWGQQVDVRTLTGEEDFEIL